MRKVLVLVVLVLVSIAAGRQPVTSPIYFLSNAPTLEVDRPVVGALTTSSGQNFKDGSYLDVLTLRGEAGEYVEIVATSNEFDTYLTLYAPDGTMWDHNDDDPLSMTTDSAIRTTLPVTGTYVVVISGFGAWDLGPYTVTRLGRGAFASHDLDVPSITVGTLERSNGLARYAFELADAAVIGIEARSTSFDTTLELFDPYGYSLAYNDDAPRADDAYTTDSALALPLPPGRYEIVVQPYFSDWTGDGSFEVEVYRMERAR